MLIFNMLKKLDDFRFIVEKRGCMNVPGLIFASEKMIPHIEKENTYQQVMNVACLPGIVKYSLAMPDIHWGYGFPIGGVAAFDVDDGVVSPGGVGYDINCGVRSLRTDLTLEEIQPYVKKLIDTIYSNVPCGVGSKGKIKVSRSQLKHVMVEGAQWAIKNGFGWNEDIERIEDYGRLDGAEPDAVSSRAIERGMPQLGSLGAGNHFLEIQVVDRIYNPHIAEKFGLFKHQIVVMIHTGSRGFGHQICSDYIHTIQRAMEKYKIRVPDRELAAVPVSSPEGESYLAAMKAGANFAWANRQMIMHWVRESFATVLGQSPEKLGMHLIYDVAHNIAKIEKHIVDGKERTLCVHRKGATRAFPSGHPVLPEIYRDTGQPVIIPGDMGTHSYILVGTEKALKETFGSTCHGAGRLLSRRKALKITAGRMVSKELEGKGIYTRARSVHTLREEVPDAYKDIDDVIDVVEGAGLSRRVARLRPLGVVKG